MSQLQHPASSVLDRSIRLVRDEPCRTPDSDSRPVATVNGAMHLLPFNEEGQVSERERDITITTSLEVPSASPLPIESRNMDSKDPTVHAKGSNHPPTSHEQPIRMTKSAGALDATSSDPPQSLSLDETRRNNLGMSMTATHTNNPILLSSDHSSSAAKSGLPEFRQSRRWAKFHDSIQPKAGHQQIDEQDRPMTMREVSFEQQRAQPKTSLQPRRAVPVSAAKTLSESDSFTQVQGLCRSLSVPTWLVMKASRMTRPQSQPTKWVVRKLSLRRHRRTASRQSEGNRSVEVTVSPRKALVKRRVRPKKAVADLRRKAGFASGAAKLVNDENVVDLDAVSQLEPEKRSASPIPSLHDPEKVKRFSQECEALLSNADFDKDWLASEKPLTALSPPLKADQTDSRRPSTGRNRSKSKTKGSAETPDSALDARNHLETGLAVEPPEPPVRTSSKGGARLASIVHITRPACIPILHGFRDGALVAIGDTGDSSTVASEANESTRVELKSRMSSSASKACHSIKGPRAVASTDTLAVIEAQIHDGVPTTIAEKLNSTAFIVGSQNRPSTSGTPPERPLPALPTTEDDFKPRVLDGPGRPKLCKPTGYNTAEYFPAGASIEIANEVQEGPPMFSTVSTGRHHRTTAVKGLRIDPSGAQISGSQTSPSLPTPSSVYSQTSSKSRHSIRLAIPFSRHDISRLRPDRDRKLKKRLKDDLARERRISEEDESKPDTVDTAEQPLPPVPQHEERGSTDPLDQFPSVPISQPLSRTSVNTKQPQGRSRSHARHSSKASSIWPKYPQQVLGTSEIKVLVDTDPLTGRFRAGALNPSPGVAGSSRDGSPVKHRRGLSSTSISIQEVNKDVINNDFEEQKKVSTTKPSLRSLRSQASSRMSVPVSKSLRHGSGDVAMESEDDISPLHSPIRGKNTRRVRRRLNSNDVPTIQMLSDDLNFCYNTIMKQEAELRQQREELQMLVRLFGPISRANGFRAVMFPSPSLKSALEKERADASSILGKELDSLKAAREKKMKDSKGGDEKLRPISHVSLTSAATHLTTGSRGTDEPRSLEGSLTDPLEYDLPSSVSAPAGLNLKAKKDKCTADRPASRGIVVATGKALHRPPPVPKMIRRGKLQEEEGKKMVVWDEQEGGDGDEGGKENRLSVNHVLTNTEQMDQALEILRSFA